MGRQKELDRLEDALEEGARLVSITGPPGVGKSALAWNFCVRHYDDESLDHFAMAEGAEHDEPEGLFGSLASRFEVELRGGARDEDARRLGRALKRRGLRLLVLDQVGSYDSVLEDWLAPLLAATEDVRLLLTSQKRLALEADERLALSPLSPDDGVELFCRELPITDIEELPSDQVERIEAIVERLDGLPLAIRLAASRYELLGGRPLLERLDEGLDVLEGTGESETGRSLRAAVRWAWTQLEEHERTVLVECSLFSGWFPVEGAEAVVEWPESSEAPDLVEVLNRLLHRSLLRSRRRNEPGSGRLLKLYRGVRDFVRPRLSDPAAELRHARWSTGLDPGIYANDSAVRACEYARSDLERVRSECSSAEPRLALRALLMLERIYAKQGRNERRGDLLSEGQTLLDSVGTSRLAARAYWQFALARMQWGELERADRQLAKGYEVASRAGNAEMATLILVRRARCNWRRGKFEESKGNLDLAAEEFVDADLHPLARAEYHALRGGLLYNDRHPARAREQFRRARQLFDEYDRPIRAAQSTARVGMTEAGDGAFREARALFEEAIATLHRGDGNQLLPGVLLEAVYDRTLRGDVDRVFDLAEEALSRSRDLAQRVMEGRSLNYRGIAHALVGDLRPAVRDFEKARMILERAGDYRFLSEAMMESGFVWLELGDPERAREELEEVTELRDGFETDVRWCIRMAQLSLYENDATRGSEHLSPAMDVEGIDRLRPRAARLYAWAALTEWKRGRTDSAVESVERAESALEPVDRSVVHGLVLVIGRWVRHTEPQPGNWQKWVGAIELPEPVTTNDRTLRDVSNEFRLLRSLYEHHFGTDASEESSRGSARLEIGPECVWFGPPGDARVDLENSRVLRSILELLVRRRVDAPGEPVSIADLVEHGWPDENLLDSAGKNRVYVSVSKLRNLGLDDILITADGGYYLDPDVPVRTPYSSEDSCR